LRQNSGQNVIRKFLKQPCNSRRDKERSSMESFAYCLTLLIIVYIQGLCKASIELISSYNVKPADVRFTF